MRDLFNLSEFHAAVKTMRIDKPVFMLYNLLCVMNTQNKQIKISLYVLTAAMLAAGLLLTFTVSDYYIFNRIGEFNALFAISQIIKKSGYLLIPLAVYYNKNRCSDIAKYILPPFVIISCFTFGQFFKVSLQSSAPAAEAVYAHINEFIPSWLNIAAYFLQCALCLSICALLFVQSGFKADKKSFILLPFALLGVIPLNLFENFFDINKISQNSFLRFKNFTVWHLAVVLVLIGASVGAYFFLKRQTTENRRCYLAAGAIALLIQYHSKDSMLLGDGYNVYKTVFAAIPLFICNIGVYVASLSVFLHKKVLYAISFFVHAAGAVTVFVYFGKNEMSNYGIFCSYSILYFCLTHSLLFILSVMPAALGIYKFRYKDCVVPLVYYCVVIIVAAVASGLVSSASMSFTHNGYTLNESEWLTPNYAFTQINPLPVTLPVIPLKIWRCNLNLLYLVILYAAYVGIFFAFNGLCKLFVLIKSKIAERIYSPQVTVAGAEIAATETGKNEENKPAIPTAETAEELYPKK